MHSFALVTTRMRICLIVSGESIDPLIACHSMIEEATALLIALETGRALTFDLFDRSMGQGKAWYAPSSVYARPINTVMIISCHSIDPQFLECIRALLAGFRMFPSSFLLPRSPSPLRRAHQHATLIPNHDYLAGQGAADPLCECQPGSRHPPRAQGPSLRPV